MKYLLEKADTANKIYLDLERIENQNMFSLDSYKDIERSIELLGFDLSKPGIIAIDEIQMAKNSSSVIKSIYDTYGTKFIVTGSSSFYIKNHFSESLAVRKRIFELNPLDFEEFLQFKGLSTNQIQKEKFQNYLPTYYNLNASGAIFENAIASQLSQIGTLNFYEKSSGTEIDFIFNQDTAIEVKETPVESDLKTLERRSAPLEMQKNILIGRKPALGGFTNFIWGGNVF